MTTSALQTASSVAERISASADRLFYAEGVQSISIERIIADARVAKSSFYSHFRSKDELVLHYLSGRMQTWERYVADELQVRGETSRDKLLAVFDLLGERFDAPGFRGSSVMRAKADGALTEGILEIEKQYRLWVNELFFGLLSDTDVGDPHWTAIQLTLVHEGSLVCADGEPDVRWAEAAREAATAILAMAEKVK